VVRVNPKRADLRLSKAQLAVFREHEWLVKRMVKRYGGSCPNIHLDDMLQHGRIALVRGIRSLGPSARNPGALLWLSVRSAAIGFLWGRNRFGSAEARDAAEHLSLDETVGVGEDGSFTRWDLFESDLAELELQSDLPCWNETKVMHELLAAAETLEPRERRFLLLRFGAGQPLQMAARRMGISAVLAKRLQRSGVKKLRAHFAQRGYKPLDQDAPVPNFGNPEGNPRSKRKR
jgi:RNA polymerase sigma factor (sigma-70 family)